MSIENELLFIMIKNGLVDTFSSRVSLRVEIIFFGMMDGGFYSRLRLGLGF